MTIDFISPWDTKLLIRSSQGTFYPIKIQPQHEQLKNFISTRSDRNIYYASNYDIFALDVTTRKRTLMRSLPWKIYCLDAAYGWIFVGGRDDGQCAFISIDQSSNQSTAARPVEVDDLLLLDLDRENRRPSREPQRTGQWARYFVRAGVFNPAYELHTHEFGGSIVNSVTIHLLPSEKKCFKDEIVVLITNNDRTLRIFSLTQVRLIKTLDFPTEMNHASSSPDGKLIIAVGDDARVFFVKRLHISTNPAEGTSSYASYDWQIIAQPALSLVENKDPCFSTAFSPSGHICAVASQGGVITIYDTALIQEDMEPNEAVIFALQSSRPSLWCGAVRSMSFSPGPLDLLAWTEEQGRMCVVDVRNIFQSRQIIDLRVDSPDLEKVDVEDQETTSEQRQHEIERRFVERHREALEAQDRLAAVSHSTDYLELAAERRRIEREALDAATRENPDALTAPEERMIDSIGLRRVSGSTLVPSDVTLSGPMSVNYPPSRHNDPFSGAGLPSPTLSANSQSRSTANIHEFMRQRNFERSRTSDRPYQPRRRSSVVVSNSISTSNTSSPQFSSTLAPIGTATPTLSTSPSQVPPSSTEPVTAHLLDQGDAWQTISDAMGSANMPADTIARLRGLHSRNLERRMQATATSQATTDRRTQTLHGARDAAITAQTDSAESRANRARDTSTRAYRQMIARRTDAGYDDMDRELLLRRLDEPRRLGRREDGLENMGIGWRDGGRKLVVATEEGILEYPVNTASRKTFPCVDYA